MVSTVEPLLLLLDNLFRSQPTCFTSSIFTFGLGLLLVGVAGGGGGRGSRTALSMVNSVVAVATTTLL
jgi:hypothetical protein